MSFLKSLAVLLLFALSTQARAGLLLEPYAGYTMGNYKTTAVTTNLEENGSVDGASFGGRAGWMMGGFFLGGEYQTSRAQLKLDGAGEGTNWANTSIFGVLGYEMFMGLRIFAGMTVTPHESEVSTTPTRTKYTGEAKKVGIGYRYHVPFAVNAEYIMYEFDKVEIGGVKSKVKERLSKFDYSAIMLSLSFPFELGGR